MDPFCFLDRCGLHENFSLQELFALGTRFVKLKGVWYVTPRREAVTLRELINLLRSAETVEQIDEHRQEILELLPEIKIMVDYDQKNYAHQYDLWFHSLHTVVYLPRGGDDGMLYLAALLHDIGKPQAQQRGKDPEDPYMHYYGHPEISRQITENIIIPNLASRGYELDPDERERLIFYVMHHDDRISLKPSKVRSIYKLRPDLFCKLMELETADGKAHIMIKPVVDRIDTCSLLADPDYVRDLLEKA